MFNRRRNPEYIARNAQYVNSTVKLPKDTFAKGKTDEYATPDTYEDDYNDSDWYAQYGKG